MSTLNTLKLISAKRTVGISPVQYRRNKLCKKIHEQIELAQAFSVGKTYTKTRFKTVQNVDGVRTSVEVQSRVRQWWWQQENGKLAVSIRYGTKIIPLSSKANAIEVATSAELVEALQLIKQAVDAGELDAQIDAASKKLRDGFSK